jgi:hypothetical protein
MDDYKEHAEGFFDFFAKFNYSNVISTHHGLVITTNQYIKPKSLGGYGFTKFYGRSNLHIAGLINQGYNAGYYIQPYELRDFKQKCKKLHAFISEKKW